MAYGILVENDQVLLHSHPGTDLWRPPGGVVESFQTPELAICRYFQASAGIMPRVESLLQTEERYWVDNQEQAWRLSVMYYVLRRPSTGIAGLVDFEKPARPEWVPVDDLHREQVQFGYQAIKAARLRRQLI
jgi:ADP-ribose pyrophosphatase YjhB (NUDIX family)